MLHFLSVLEAVQGRRRFLEMRWNTNPSQRDFMMTIPSIDSLGLRSGRQITPDEEAAQDDPRAGQGSRSSRLSVNDTERVVDRGPRARTSFADATTCPPEVTTSSITSTLSPSTSSSSASCRVP
jgi:hypothetical protein